jgi:CDP-glucose 4,6-dehydratase
MSTQESIACRSAGFWTGKRVLVTGHTGFKGSWLSLWLQMLGAKVIGYSLTPPTTPSLFEVARVSEAMTSILGDVRDLAQLQAVVNAHAPQVTIHMAGQPIVRRSYHDPVETYSTNIMGTVNVLEAIRNLVQHDTGAGAGRTRGPHVVICITSDKCYENKEWLWGYRENDPMGGHDPYSSSKGCAELVIAAYRSSFFPVQDYRHHHVAVASTRAGNVIGGGDWSQDRLIPDIMRALIEGRPVDIRSPHAVRPWLHVLDPLNGYLSLAEQLWTNGPQFAQAWNLGAPSEEARSVQWIVENLMHLWASSTDGEEPRWELDLARHPHESRYLKLDCSKARALLGWQPKLDLQSALEWIVEWYRALERSDDMRALTQDQIARFEQI